VAFVIVAVAVFEFIEANQANFPTAVMCRVLGVSTSGYYDWRRRPPSARAIADEVLTEQIKHVHGQSREIYGYRRITAELVDGPGHTVGRHRVARLMRAAGIQGVTRRKFCRTTRRDDAPDLLNRDFSAAGPDRRWVADITFVPPGQGSCSWPWSSTSSAAGGGLVHVGEPADRPRHPSAADGRHTPPARSCRRASQRPGLPIHQLRLRPGVPGRRGRTVDGIGR
jgi:hypothetical protein